MGGFNGSRLKNGTADRDKNHQKFDLTLFDNHFRLTINQNKSGDPRTTPKNGKYSEKPEE
jgi:hypothetical protein